MREIERLFENTPIKRAGAIEGSGNPSFEPGRELGGFFARNGQTFHVLWSGDARETEDANVVEVELTTDGPIDSRNLLSWDRSDLVLEESDSRFRTKAIVDVGYDGFDLDLSSAAVARFDCQFSDDFPLEERNKPTEELRQFTKTKGTSRHPGLVNLGAEQTTPDQLPVTVWLDEQLLEQKFGVASAIWDVTPNVDEISRTEKTLTELFNAVHAGDVEPSLAVNAVERMVMGENVTLSMLTALGPAGAEINLDRYFRHVSRPSKGKEPTIEELNIVGEYVEGWATILIPAVVAKATLFALKTWDYLTYAVDAAIESVIDFLLRQLDNIIQLVLSKIPTPPWSTIRRDIDGLADKTREHLTDDQDPDQLMSTYESTIGEWRKTYERNYVNWYVSEYNLDDDLEVFLTALGGDGTVVDGDLNVAKQNAQKVIDNIHDTGAYFERWASGVDKTFNPVESILKSASQVFRGASYVGYAVEAIHKTVSNVKRLLPRLEGALEMAFSHFTAMTISTFHKPALAHIANPDGGQ